MFYSYFKMMKEMTLVFIKNSNRFQLLIRILSKYNHPKSQHDFSLEKFTKILIHAYYNSYTCLLQISVLRQIL